MTIHSHPEQASREQPPSASPRTPRRGFGKGLLLALAAAALAPAGAMAADTAALEAHCRKLLGDWNVPGFSIAVVSDRGVLFTQGYGIREVGKDGKVTPDTLFAIASNTKAFTAAALAILADRKKLSWDDRVRNYLPYFEVFQDPEISAEARVDDLLCHRIGFRTFSGDLLWWNTNYSPAEVLKRARLLPPAYSFRRGYGYSNLMFVAAGEVIEQASGKTWERFVRDELLTPLDMGQTALSVAQLGARGDVANPHAEENGRPVPIPWQPWNNVAAAGGIISSATDMAKWLRLQLNRGAYQGRRIYSEDAAWKMWSIHNPLQRDALARAKEPWTEFSGVGLGWFVADHHGTLIVRHGGGYDGMFSHVVIAPQKKIGVVVLSNSQTDLPRALATHALDFFAGFPYRDWSSELLKKDKEKREHRAQEQRKREAARLPNVAPTLPLEKYAGVYSSELYGDVQVEAREGKLIMRMLPSSNMSASLTPWHGDVFAIQWDKRAAWFTGGLAQFGLSPLAEVLDLKLDVPNEDLWFDELDLKRKK